MIATVLEALSLQAGVFLRRVIFVELLPSHLLIDLHLVLPIGTHTDLEGIESGQLAFVVEREGVSLLVGRQLALILLLIVYLRGVEIAFLLVCDPAGILMLSIALHHHAQ